MKLVVDALDRRLLALADGVDVAVQGEADAVAGEPHHHLLALIECRSRRQVGHDDAVGVLFAVTAADDYFAVVGHGQSLLGLVARMVEPIAPNLAAFRRVSS